MKKTPHTATIAFWLPKPLPDHLDHQQHIALHQSGAMDVQMQVWTQHIATATSTTWPTPEGKAAIVKHLTANIKKQFSAARGIKVLQDEGFSSVPA